MKFDVVRVSGLDFRDSGFGFQDPGFRFRVSGFGNRVSGCGFRVSGSGFLVSFSEFRVPGAPDPAALARSTAFFRGLSLGAGPVNKFSNQ